MRIVRLMMTGVLAWVVAIGFAVAPQARQASDEDYDKIMKGVGAANGAMRKAMATDAAAASAEAKKLIELFKSANAFWTARKNTEAADLAAGAMKQAMAVDAALSAKNMDGAAEAAKTLGGSCMTCHGKYREKTEAGFAIRKQ
jgi:cytochrome c556